MKYTLGSLTALSKEELSSLIRIAQGGKSRRAFATETGISIAQLNRIATGKYVNHPSGKTLQKLLPYINKIESSQISELPLASPATPPLKYAQRVTMFDILDHIDLVIGAFEDWLASKSGNWFNSKTILDGYSYPISPDQLNKTSYEPFLEKYEFRSENDQNRFIYACVQPLPKNWYRKAESIRLKLWGVAAHLNPASAEFYIITDCEEFWDLLVHDKPIYLNIPVSIILTEPVLQREAPKVLKIRSISSASDAN